MFHRCFCGQRATNMCSCKLVKTSNKKGSYLTKQKSVFYFLLLASLTWNCVKFISRDGSSDCVLDAAQPLVISSPHLPFIFRFLWSWIHFNPDLPFWLVPHDGPDVTWLGPVLAKGNRNWLNKSYWGDVIWMYYQYTEYHGMSRWSLWGVNIKKRNEMWPAESRHALKMKMPFWDEHWINKKTLNSS